MNNRIKFYILFSLALASIACKKLIEVGVPKTQLTPTQAFSNDQSAVAVISNIYAEFNAKIDGNFTPLLGLYADELLTTSSESRNLEYYNGLVSIQNSGNLNIWESLYSVIYQSNALLENIEISPQISETARSQLKGEALFLRALAFFYLTNIYGDVPALITTQVALTSLSYRDSTARIYLQIVSDLTQAKSLLSESYPNSDKVRANKWTAIALLSRVYLYQGNWQMADSESSTIINSGIYTPLDNIKDVFKKNSTEAILQFWTTDGFTREGSLFIPQELSIPTYALTSGLMNSFESGDFRKLNWTDSIVSGAETYYYPFKYKNRSSVTGISQEYLTMFRLSEQYLIRAEARAQQNNINEALEDLNMIRERAGLSDIYISDKLTLLAQIAHERRVELFCEWGHRFFDLKRYGIINQTLSPLKTNWSTISALLPIPEYELLNNPNLTQNPGY